MALNPEQIQTLKRQLLKKGAEINEKLTQLMNGLNPSVQDILAGSPGETKIEKLRRWLEMVDKQIKRIGRGEYGTCEQCRADLTFEGLSQVPWADTCPTCAAKESA